MSANEFGRLTPAMQREVVKLGPVLGEALQEGAERAGKSMDYVSGLKEYASAMKVRDARVER